MIAKEEMEEELLREMFSGHQPPRDKTAGKADRERSTVLRFRDGVIGYAQRAKSNVKKCAFLKTAV